jgi:hypothetical protein
VDTVQEQLESAGFEIRAAQFGLSRNDARLFATMDLTARLADGVTIAVGIRNSLDKSLPLGFIAGSRVFCCDNLAFRSDLLVARKHTRNGQERFIEAISLAVHSLGQFQQEEAARIQFLQHRELTDESAESIMLRAFEARIVSHRMLPRVIRGWRQPEHPEFQPRTAWSLHNAFTWALGPRAKSNAQQHAALTIRLAGLFGGDGATHPGRPIALEPPWESAN